MTYSLVSSSVSVGSNLATYNINTSHPKNETSAQAINIGNLTQEGEVVSVSDKGTAASAAVSTTFTALDGIASLTESFANVVDNASTQFQLYDNQNNLIADNYGSAAQMVAYTEWAAGTLPLAAGTYTAIATPSTYTGAPSLTISKSEQQGTSLSVNSSLTGSDPSEYYNFSFSGNNMKLAFDAGSSNQTRVQLLNSNGNVVADSQGDAFQKSNYQQLTSGTGLSTSSGNYTVKVTFANNADNSSTIPYNFQLFSGNSYAVSYTNNVKAQPTDNTAAGSVTATTDAQLYSRNAFNTINEKPSAAVNIGWLQQDKSSLNVLSQLTSADSADYYSFTLQQGNNLKFGFDGTQTKNASDLRVQILNNTGTQVIADSAGTPAQQAAYKELTTTNGMQAKPGNYLVKLSYATGVTKTNNNYAFNIFSGTSYSAQYKTIASAQTYGNALLQGTLTGSNASSAMASYLTALSNGDTSTSLTTALSAKV